MPIRTVLLTETRAALQRAGKGVEDVRWIGTIDGDQTCSWTEFVQMANHPYDADFGSALVRCDLVVVGDDWWLERRSHAGQEWWAFVSRPKNFRNGPLQTVWEDPYFQPPGRYRKEG